LALVQKKLQQVWKGNQALTRYINARRKKKETQRKEEVRKKAKEEVQKKVMVVAQKSDEGQSFKDVRT
jgi:hypothetical protein